MHPRVTFLVGILMLFICVSTTVADIPRLITYQGRLTDEFAETLPDDDYSMHFAIYSDSLVGDLLWEESQMVAFNDGLFDVQLGAESYLHDSVFKWYPNLFLAMELTASPGEFAPRTRLTATAFSFHALVADTAGYAANSNWYLDDDVLRTNQQYGLARGGPDNHVFGAFKNTMVNLGHHSTVGFEGLVDNVTIGGGAYHLAQEGGSTICGGYADTVTGASGTIAGGSWNTISGNNSWLGGGFHNYNAGTYSVILGGHNDTILAGVDHSYLFGFRSQLTTDSTFMVDVPYIRFGDEATGYVFPANDGATGQALITDGSGTLSWLSTAASSGWVDDGTVVRLQTGSDYVGIGTSTPGERLVVGKNLGSYEGEMIVVGNPAIDGEAGLTAGYDNDNRGWLTWYNEERYLRLGARVNGQNYPDRVVIANGNVGIKNSAPMVDLDVTGAMRAVVGAQDEVAVTGVASGLHGQGIYGEATQAGVGVYGNGVGARGVGVKGESMAGAGAGVVGVADGANGYGVSGRAMGEDGRGVYAKADYQDAIAIEAWADGLRGKAFYGKANQDGGVGIEVEAMGSSGVGLVARSGSGGVGAKFYGNVLLYSNADESLIMELGEGLDYAEGFNVSDESEIPPGTVLSIDPDHPGELTVCASAYDTKVAGIVAGANGLGSGVRLGADDFDHDIALAGRVYCNVDATQGAIEPGDLLTTSSIPGYAMKAADHERAQGAILGKAMEKLEQGQTGQILVLVTLQ